MSDRAAFRGTFRTEADQISKVEPYTCKIAGWKLKASSCEAFSHKVPSSMLDCVSTRGKTTQIGFSITYLWKVDMGGRNCTLGHTKLAC